MALGAHDPGDRGQRGIGQLSQVFGALRALETRARPLAFGIYRTYVPLMDRFSELESMRRSIAMLNPRASALDREEAMALLQELQDVDRRLRTLRDGLRRLLDEG